jgi:hypothetical protein
MNTFTLWKYGSIFLLAFALVGCYHPHYDDDDTHRDTSTEVVCSSDSFCDPASLTCTSTFDEIFTTFIDEYGHDFDRYTTITEDTLLTRIDDVDETLNILASEQTESVIITTTEDEIFYDDDDDEHVTITTTEEQILTTWTQACPTCQVEVCTSSSGRPVLTCSFVATFPPFPQCES